MQCLQTGASHIALNLGARQGWEMKKMSQQVAQDAAIAGMKAAPGVAVVATGATGAINWSDIAYMLTAVYMLGQILLLIPQYRRMLAEAVLRKKEKRKQKELEKAKK